MNDTPETQEAGMDIDRKILVQAVREAAERSDNSGYFEILADNIANGRAAQMDTWLALDAIWIALKTDWKPHD